MKTYAGCVLGLLVVLLPCRAFPMTVPSSPCADETLSDTQHELGGGRRYEDEGWIAVGKTGLFLINVYAFTTLQDEETRETGETILRTEGTLLLMGGIGILVMIGGLSGINN